MASWEAQRAQLWEKQWQCHSIRGPSSECKQRPQKNSSLRQEAHCPNPSTFSHFPSSACSRQIIRASGLTLLHQQCFAEQRKGTKQSICILVTPNWWHSLGMGFPEDCNPRMTLLSRSASKLPCPSSGMGGVGIEGTHQEAKVKALSSFELVTLDKSHLPEILFPHLSNGAETTHLE